MPENELRIGVIGTGAIGRTHIERINTKLKGGRVIACADTSAAFCQSVAEKYGLKAYESGEELINAQDIDAVIVTTIDAFHAKYVLAAIKAGKYVFCEKPLAPEATVCRQIVDEEMKTGKKLVQVGFMRRYDSGYLQLKEAIQSRTYGEPLLLHCAHRNASVDDSYTTAMEVENSMIHEIDVLRWLLEEDYDKVEVVFGKRTRHAHEGLQDPQVMILTTKSGVRIDVEAFVNDGNNYEIKCEVVCEDAILNLPEPAYIQVTAGGRKGMAIDTDWTTRFADAYDAEIQQWIHGVREGRVDGPTAWDGYVGQATAAAASKARDTQTVVKINLEEAPAFYRS